MKDPSNKIYTINSVAQHQYKEQRQKYENIKYINNKGNWAWGIGKGGWGSVVREICHHEITVD